jgi:SNF2 family DNA or RNA helicase
MTIKVSRTFQKLVIPRDGQTEALFPGGVPIPPTDDDPHPLLMVDHNLTSTIVLRSLGHSVPNPILSYYDFGHVKPFLVQRRTMDLMTTAPRCYVLNSMGTGKTKATLWAWDYLHGNSHCGKMLVVATLSTLKFVWQAEAFATLPNRRVEVLHGSKKHRLERLAEPADIYVINHDGLKTIMPELLQRTDIDVLVLDEVAVYRNNSERSKDMRKFSQRFKFVWGLTGRPMPNEPTDVWGISKVVTPNTSPKYFRQAQEMLMTKVNNFKWIPRPEAIERAMVMLQPNVRFDLNDVIELPEVISRTIDVPLTKLQEKTYRTLADQFTADVGSGQVTAVNAAVAMGKLLQVSGGWVYARRPDGEMISVPVFKVDDPMPRHQMLVDLINENERKVIIYVPFRHAIEGLSPILDAAGIDHAVVHGEVSQNARGDLFNAFQNTTKYKALLAHPQCVAHGLTLTAADTIIWYMPITSLETYEQANARITRVGQRFKQKVLHLQSTQVERKIYALLQRKQRVQDTLLELLADATEKMAA